ncbi:MAG: HD domain-containing protein [Candidatus Baldrarchaeia archaeon]
MNVSTFMEQLKSQLQSLLYYWCVSVNLFPDHGFHHCERVLNYANKLLDELVKISHGRVYDLYEEENFLLKISAYVHDIGMLCGRENHSIHSANIIKARLPSTLMQLNREEREVLSEIVKRHSSKMPIHDLDPQ